MIKLDGVPLQQPLPIGDKEVRNKVGSADFDFYTELEDRDEEISRDDLQKLLDKIDEQGARLTKTPTYDELKEYRTLIKNFVGTAVGQMYSVNNKTGWDRFGRQKAYTTVRKIDRELENMAESIRLGQADELSIIASHDAIKGMLVDLYM